MRCCSRNFGDLAALHLNRLISFLRSISVYVADLVVGHGCLTAPLCTPFGSGRLALRPWLVRCSNRASDCSVVLRHTLVLSTLISGVGPVVGHVGLAAEFNKGFRLPSMGSRFLRAGLACLPLAQSPLTSRRFHFRRFRRLHPWQPEQLGVPCYIKSIQRGPSTHHGAPRGSYDYRGYLVWPHGH